MDHFKYHDNSLYAEDICLRSIADQYGTPCYVYSRATLEKHWHTFNDGFKQHPHLICFAVKASSNLAILNLLARLGSGFDIVSIGELERVLVAGGSADKIVFSGVGKREDELKRALEVGIHCFNVEVPEEFDRLNKLAGAMGKTARVSLRVNPDVDAKTHPYISTGLKENKFGIDINRAVTEYKRVAQLPSLEIVGIDCHIGSQLIEISPFLDAMDRVLLLADELKQHNINIKHLDLGGGLGIRYQDETPVAPKEYIKALLKKLGSAPYEIIIEPGRAIAGNAGILLTTVEYLKLTDSKNFAIADAAMNDLIRPALYNAWQEIIPVQKKSDGNPITYDIVGPVCETGDFLGKDRKLSIQQGDLLAIRSSGAYGFTMSSNYNSRPRPAEVMVDGKKVTLIRKRELLQQLWNGENILD